MYTPAKEETTQVTEAPVAQEKKELTPEEQLEQAKKVTMFKHKQLVNIIGLHVQNFWAIANSHGTSFNRKEQVKAALIEGLQGALNHGVTDMKLREKGNLAKEVNSFAATLVQALENKLLIIAQNFKEEDFKTETKGETNGSEQTQTSESSGSPQD